MKYLLLVFLVFSNCCYSQLFDNEDKIYSQADTLKGSNTEYRNWWNVLKYDITVEPNFNEKFIQGQTEIFFTIDKNLQNKTLQIDLQEPLQIDSIYLSVYNKDYFENKQNNPVVYINLNKNIKKLKNIYLIQFNSFELQYSDYMYYLRIVYSGHPILAKNPPWDGGWIFTHDDDGNHWMSVACQGIGASVWYPCKDYLGDEPDLGASLKMIVPKELEAVSNGNKISEILIANDKKEVKWEVKNPINTYNIIPYIGKYIHFSDTFMGEKRKLPLNYWVLNYNLKKAKQQFSQVKSMMQTFEKWFGPYPFYEDGYQLIEAPYLGMEHQSGIAYGNKYLNGYLGNDLSETGWGLKWDFIIVHESGHEWFGNNISVEDTADLWIHESFTAYSETLYVEEQFGKKAANEYVIGTRKNIQNDKPIIGKYKVNEEGSGDMYYKGANMIHTLRQLLGDDVKFKSILRKMNTQFRHKIVTSQLIEEFLSKETGIDLAAFFNQYLRSTQIPNLEYKLSNNKIKFRYTNIVKDFDMPLLLENKTWIYPTNEWKSIKYKNKNIGADKNFYITMNK